MKMISQSRAEKLAKLYEAASEILGRRGDHDAEVALIVALNALDGGNILTNPMQVLDGD